MRTSLVTRLLAASITIAVVAVIATAWLATRTTTDRLVGEFDRGLEADGFIYSQLVDHAATHQDWDAIGPLVDELARRTGRRIALTTQDGELLADSHTDPASPDDALALPEPAALIDPLAPLLTIHGAETGGLLGSLPPAMVIPEGGLGPGLATEVGSDGCLVDGDLWHRLDPRDVAARPSDGYLASGVIGWYPPTAGQRDVVDDEPLPPDDGQDAGPADVPPDAPNDAEEGRPPLGTDRLFLLIQDCRVDGFPLPDPTVAALHAQLTDEVAACLDQEGIAHVTELAGWTVDGDDEAAPSPYLRVLPLPHDLGAAEVADRCAEDTHRRVLADHLAAPAVLHLGSGNPEGAFAAAGSDRLLVAVVAVLLVTLGITIIAGRRLLRPVLDLTRAAEHLADGDHPARVEVRGRDELGRLARAFNTMVETLEVSDRQRRMLVSDVAHELRNPLTNLRGYLDGAEEGVVELDADLVASLQEEAELLERLMDDLQQLALADAGALALDLRPVDVAEVATQAVASSRPVAAEAGIDIEVVTTGRAIVSGDASRLRQVVGNLVANAVRYTPAGGVVTVRCTAGDDRVTVEVEDTGPGIAEEHLPHLFDRFYRVDPSRTRATGGAGIGLAIVRTLTEAHGGSVEVHSTVGSGTRFTVHLPAPSGSGVPRDRG
jgi:two-component system, OmpR family, sensor histidine kinase BaeS